MINFDENFDEDFDEEAALSVLLKDGILFCNSMDYHNGKCSGTTIGLFVSCSDTFAWGYADAEDLLTIEIESLYNLHVKDKKWGSTKWVCLKRNQKPQKPVVDLMKKYGVWDDVMEKLPENNYDKILKEESENKKLKTP